MIIKEKPFFDKFLAKRFVFIRNSSYICTCLQPVDYDAHRGGWSYLAGHYIREKASHDALSIGFLKLPQKMSAKDNAEYGATGMLDSISRCVRKGYPRLQRTLNGYFSNTFVGITLFVSTQGCGRPQEADEQEVDTHVFVV